MKASAACLALMASVALIACGGSGTDTAPAPAPAPGSPTPPPVSAPPPAPAPAPSAPITALTLPRVAWEGGSEYWSQFKRAREAGWTDPAFFPIGLWYGGISSNAEAQFDKARGINFYIGMWEGTPYSLFQDNGVFWIGGKLNDTFAEDSKNWVGAFLDDEVDGRFSPAEGRQHLQSLVNALPNHDRPRYANFTQMVVSSDMAASDAQAYVNGYTDMASLDMYWYTIPHCDQKPYRAPWIVDVPESGCKTSASYGRMAKALRMRDASDGKLQPIWQFLELLNGIGDAASHIRYISPGELKGAVMSSLINEARGIMYFNQSFGGPCQGSNLMRLDQVDSAFCGHANVEAAKEINALIHRMAPVLNTQSYAFNFGAGLDTMLKVHGGAAYVFAMSTDSAAGCKRFTLPAELSGRHVEVVDESRTVTVDSANSFCDSFDREYSFHIYKIQ